MIGIPEDLPSFRRKFSTNRDCLEYLARSRWPEGFVCPECSNRSATLIESRYLFQCRSCRKQTSPMAGTLIHRSHIPLQEWFLAAHQMIARPNGISALQLQKTVGIGSYKSALNLLTRLRKAMGQKSNHKLSGLVRIYLTSLGKQSHDRTIRIIGAIEVITYIQNGKKKERPGMLRLAVIPEISEARLKEFVAKNIARGSRICTNSEEIFSKRALAGYRHLVRRVNSPEMASKRFPNIHGAFRSLKSWLGGTHRQVSARYLQEYLDEFVFRFNAKGRFSEAFGILLGITVGGG